MIIRDAYLQRIILFIDTELIKVITGVRRSGKSVMLEIIKSYLLNRGVHPSQFLSLNFEELANEPYLDYRSLNDFIEQFIARNQKKSYIFLDEIQEVMAFEKVVNSLRARYGDKVDLYITGSNAKLLSGELATLLGGRYISFEIFPFTFSEFVQGKRRIGQEGSDMDLFQSFLVEGGMPFLTSQNFTYQDRASYLSDLYNSIILKDIVERESIREPELLRRLLNYLFANPGRTFSANSIVKYLKNEGIGASVTTIVNYISFAQSAYVVIPIKRFDIQGKKFLTTQEKNYVIDHGLRQAIVGRNEQDVELVLENIVLLELIHRGYEVFVGKTNAYEIDFIAEKKTDRGIDRKYFQVSYLLTSEETRDRELRSLKEIRNNYEKIVLSLDPITRDSEGIKHQNLLKWLLEFHPSQSD